MARSIIGVIIGLAAAMAVVFIVQMIGHLVYPPPADLTMDHPETIRKYLETAPLGALLFVLLAWVAGAMLGAWLAATIARRKPITHGMIIGGIILAMCVVMFVKIPHPAWFMIAGVLVVPLAAYNGASMAPKPKAATSRA